MAVILIGALLASCQMPSVILHDTHAPKGSAQGHDLLLRADEHQALHYRYLAAEHVGAASRLAKDGDEATMTQMLYSAIEYQGIAEEIEERAANRGRIEQP